MSLFPGLFTRNWQLKLSALGLAVLLWTSLRVEAMDRQILPSVPVRVQLNDPQWSMENEPRPRTVEVHFSGPARELFSLYLERPTVTVPVDQVFSQDTTILLRSEWVRLPNRQSVVVEQIRPRNVSLAFEPITQAVVPVSLGTEGSLPQGIALTDSLSVSPEAVRISGPASAVRRVETVGVEPLDLSDISEPGDHTRALEVDTVGLSEVLISPNTVEVTVTTEERTQRTIPDVPVVPPEGRGEVQLDPLLASVTVFGPRSRVEALNPGNLRVEVPLEELPRLEPGEERRVPVVVRGLPDRLEARATPDSATARRPETDPPSP